MEPVTTEAIEGMVRRAVAELPDEFRERLDNLDFAVEPAAGPEHHPRGTRVRGTLLGLYRGVPRSARGAAYGGVLPDLIVIFQQPLERMARDEEHLYELVRHTVRHEIAHHFGISDGRLRELGAY